MDDPSSELFAPPMGIPFEELSFTDLTKTQVVTRLCRIALARAQPSIQRALQSPEESIHFGVPLDAQHVLQDDPVIGNMLVAHAAHMLLLFEDALRQAQQSLMEAAAPTPPLVFKQNIHARLYNLPLSTFIFKRNISIIRAQDVGTLITIHGTVIRTGTVRMQEFEREYECTRCKSRVLAFSDIEQGNVFDVPKYCDAPAPAKGGHHRFAKGGDTPNQCGGTSFKYIEGSHICRDYQQIKVQEQVQNLAVGSIPRSILAVLQDDLVDGAQAGDDVVLTGLLLRMWEPVVREERCNLVLFILANSVRLNDGGKAGIHVSREQRARFANFWRKSATRPLAIRNAIVGQVCPQLYGLHLTKLSVLLTLIGGVRRVTAQGTTVRGESHLLIIGDPGTGKSQLLRYAAKVSPRSVMTTGVGTTNAGLTVTAVREKSTGEWSLEAGALVLADGGLCCIDEFGCIREADRATIHEAMEQQTLSVAKAGLVCTLNTRTTMFACLNPKGEYDPDAELCVNTAIASPLLSRFDIILLMLDQRDEEWDRRVTDHILRSLEAVVGEEEQQGAKAKPVAPPVASSAQKNGPKLSFSHTRTPSARGNGFDAVGLDLTGASSVGEPVVQSAYLCAAIEVPSVDEQEFTMDDMQAYLYHIKSTLDPGLTRFSGEVLTRYYGLQRQDGSRNASRTTIRLLESLIRLAQAHARLMFRTVVMPMDAVMAVFVVESSAQMQGMLPGIDALMESTFGIDPDAAYVTVQEQVLSRLGLLEAFQSVPAHERLYDYEEEIIDPCIGVDGTLVGPYPYTHRVHSEKRAAARTRGSRWNRGQKRKAGDEAATGDGARRTVARTGEPSAGRAIRAKTLSATPSMPQATNPTKDSSQTVIPKRLVPPSSANKENIAMTASSTAGWPSETDRLRLAPSISSAKRGLPSGSDSLNPSPSRRSCAPVVGQPEAPPRPAGSAPATSSPTRPAYDADIDELLSGLSQTY